MDRIRNKRGVLQKVGESLYRYSSNRVYYARIKKDGKEIKRSLGTTDPALARRNLAALKMNYDKSIALRDASPWRN